MAKNKDTKFFVYEHWRPDTNSCFYVGKGRSPKGGNPYRRASQMDRGRNKHHGNVVNKLISLGLQVDVRIIFESEIENDAFAKEIERIAFWRNLGVNLVNIASGGGKNSGWKLSEERIQFLRERMRGKQFRLGAKLSEETKRKISQSNMGKTYSDAYKAAMVVATTGEKNGFFGKTHSVETRAKVAESNRNRVWSEESKAKLSATMKSKPPRVPRTKTWTHGPEARENYRIGAKKRWEKWRQQKNAARSP